MTTTQLARSVTNPSRDVRDQLYRFVTHTASDPRVRKAVEDNHDSNRWWPPDVEDWRMRLVIAGWSARISYSMIETYARVVGAAADVGFDRLMTMNDGAVGEIIGPLGLRTARISYLRSVGSFLTKFPEDAEGSMLADPDSFIRTFAGNVAYASYKVAQCATLYACGYHCGVIPVDSGMVEKLAPCLGWRFSRGPIAHEEMRSLLEAAAHADAARYRRLVTDLGYGVSIPSDVDPTWWLHLVLIYHKRFSCTYRAPDHCAGLAAWPAAPQCRAASATS